MASIDSLASDVFTQKTLQDLVSTGEDKRVASADLDKNAFLKVLMAQLSNQDPLSPMEDTAFISELAQFTALEQSMEANAQAASSRAENMIGKEVAATSVFSNGVEQEAQVYGTVEGALTLKGEQYVRLSDGTIIPLGSVVGVYDPIEEKAADTTTTV